MALVTLICKFSDKPDATAVHKVADLLALKRTLAKLEARGTSDVFGCVLHYVVVHHAFLFGLMWHRMRSNEPAFCPEPKIGGSVHSTRFGVESAADG